MASTKKPWAVLLCCFKNKAALPPEPPGVIPFRTACEHFFTKAGTGYNLVRYFLDVSHGSVDIGDSQVFGWFPVDANITGYTPQNDPIYDKTQGQIVALARQAASNAGVPLNAFVGVVVIMNVATGWAQGGPGWVAADWRRVDGRNFDGTLGPRSTGGGNGTEAFGQEMGHGFGLDHSRRNGSDDDYMDPWDVMSGLNAYSVADPDYCARGPGLNAWNIRGRGWLDETRVWRSARFPFSDVIQLRPLFRRDLPGFLCAEISTSSAVGPLLLEFRTREAWDAGLPDPVVLIHRFNRNHSYVLPGTSGRLDLKAGEALSLDFLYDDQTQYVRVNVAVRSIDEPGGTASVFVSGEFYRPPPIKDLDNT